MKIYHQLVPCQRFHDAVDHVNAFLVIPVKEIDLESFHPDSRIVGRSLFQFIIQDISNRPDKNSDSTRGGIFNHPDQIKVYAFTQRHDVIPGRPSFVHHNVGKSEAGGEIDVSEIGLGVDTRLEVNSRQPPVVPPFPGTQTRLHPIPLRRVTFAWLRQQIDKVIDRQFLVFIRNRHNPPRVSPSRGGPRDHILPCGDLLLATRGMDVATVRQTGELALESAFSSLQEHPGIGFQIRLADHSLHPVVTLDGHRKESQRRLGSEFADSLMSIGILESVRIGIFPH